MTQPENWIRNYKGPNVSKSPHVKKFRKFLAIGCSHGAFVDPYAVEAVMKFKEAFKPDVRIHLGDIFDFAAFRSGAVGTKDESAHIGDDLRAGIKLLHEYEPTHVLIGNHDERVWKLSGHPNAIISHAASMCRNEFLTACGKAKAMVVDTYDVRRSWIQLGNYKVMHGFFYNENALRDHAETYGNVVIAHLHSPGIQRARRSDATGYCVGMLADGYKLDYAKARRATLRWGLGFVWGDFSDKECFPNLAQCESGNARNWRLPI